MVSRLELQEFRGWPWTVVQEKKLEQETMLALRSHKGGPAGHELFPAFTQPAKASLAYL